jgi:hypothetical protein
MFEKKKYDDVEIEFTLDEELGRLIENGYLKTINNPWNLGAKGRVCVHNPQGE